MAPLETIIIPINQCRHYCGFRYGSDSFNPYENYILALNGGAPLKVIRERFEDFLRFYRPRSFGDVFGLRLPLHIPLWVYPWEHGNQFRSDQGWMKELDQVPDIITHFCELGIKRSRIEEEYTWLERAHKVISTRGYQPEIYGYITVFELKDTDQSIYIVKDGNHRLSTLVALGHNQVCVKRISAECVDREQCRSWPQVVNGNYLLEDALAIFDIYLKGVDGFIRSKIPAMIQE